MGGEQPLGTSKEAAPGEPPCTDEARPGVHEVVEQLLGCDWPDRTLCLRVCGMAVVLVHLDPLPADVSGDIQAVNRHLRHCAFTGQGPDWVALARRLGRTLARCGLAPAARQSAVA